MGQFKAHFYDVSAAEVQGNNSNQVAVKKHVSITFSFSNFMTIFFVGL